MWQLVQGLDQNRHSLEYLLKPKTLELSLMPLSSLISRFFWLYFMNLLLSLLLPSWSMTSSFCLDYYRNFVSGFSASFLLQFLLDRTPTFFAAPQLTFVIAFFCSGPSSGFPSQEEHIRRAMLLVLIHICSRLLFLSHNTLSTFQYFSCLAVLWTSQAYSYVGAFAFVLCLQPLSLGTWHGLFCHFFRVCSNILSVTSFLFTLPAFLLHSIIFFDTLFIYLFC